MPPLALVKERQFQYNAAKTIECGRKGWNWTCTRFRTYCKTFGARTTNHDKEFCCRYYHAQWCTLCASSILLFDRPIIIWQLCYYLIVDLKFENEMKWSESYMKWNLQRRRSVQICGRCVILRMLTQIWVLIYFSLFYIYQFRLSFTSSKEKTTKVW